MNVFCTKKRFPAAVVGLVFAMASLASGPSEAQQDTQGWRTLCMPGNEVEILVGGSWYRAVVVAPDQYGEASCDVLNTSYSGHELRFAMAPERMRSVQAPNTPGPRTGPAPTPGAPSQEAWRALCVPGGEVEILVGSAWYKGVVIGPDQYGEASCDVLNTSYSGHELRFAMAPERMRVVPSPSETADEQPGFASLPPAPAVSVALAEIGESYRVNTVAARQRFEGRTVTLSGTLQSVGSNYIRLTDGPFGIAMCNFDEAQEPELASLAPGARLTVQGDDAWSGWGTFQLRSCRVLNEQAAQPTLAQDQVVPANGRPPLGRYVCRQYMTTIGYIHLGTDSYVVNGTSGSYNFDDRNGTLTWNGGAYAGWPARYEFSPAGAGHAHDEHIIRMTDDTGRLTIDCFLMAD